PLPRPRGEEGRGGEGPTAPERLRFKGTSGSAPCCSPLSRCGGEGGGGRGAGGEGSGGGLPQQPPPRRVTHQLGRVVDAELLHQAVAVVVGGLDADAEGAGDLLRRLALDDEMEDLALARREGAVGIVRGALGMPVLLGERPRRLRAEVTLAGVEGAHGGEQLADGAVLHQVAGGAGADEGEHVLFLL